MPNSLDFFPIIFWKNRLNLITVGSLFEQSLDSFLSVPKEHFVLEQRCFVKCFQVSQKKQNRREIAPMNYINWHKL